MEDPTTRAAPDSCPHLNRDDPRCASRLCLGRLEQAFSVCFGAFHVCPMFHIISRERRAGVPPTMAATAETILTPLTLHQKRLTLRPTGT